MRLILGIAQADNSALFWGGGAPMGIVCPEHAGGTWTLQWRNPAYTLGPGTNVFANDAARDAYFGNGGADLLAEYNANRGLLIQNGNNTQRRNAAGTGWENYNTLAQWIDTAIEISTAGITTITVSADLIFRLNGGTTGAIIYIDQAPAVPRGTRNAYGQYDERP